jgi:hypothetical protein
MGRRLIPLALAACLVEIALIANSASAGFMPEFTGWTMMSDTSASGVVDFAVYQNAAGHNWETDLGLNATVAGVVDSSGGSTVDATASYVFFYEVVTTGTTALSQLSVPSYSTPYSSGGYLSGTVFNDADGAVGPSANKYIGPNPSGTPPDNQQYYYPSQSGQSLALSPFTNSGVSPKFPGGGIDLGGNAGLFQDQAVFQFNLANLLSAGRYSTVLFLTSNTSPTYANGSVSGGALSSDGNIPTQAPEPTTLAMWGLGALGLALALLRRKRVAPNSC